MTGEWCRGSGALCCSATRLRLCASEPCERGAEHGAGGPSAAAAARPTGVAAGHPQSGNGDTQFALTCGTVCSRIHKYIRIFWIHCIYVSCVMDLCMYLICIYVSRTVGSIPGYMYRVDVSMMMYRGSDPLYILNTFTIHCPQHNTPDALPIHSRVPIHPRYNNAIHCPLWTSARPRSRSTGPPTSSAARASSPTSMAPQELQVHETHRQEHVSGLIHWCSVHRSH